MQSFTTEHLKQLKRLSLRFVTRKGFNLTEAEDLFQQSILKALTTEAKLRSSEKMQTWFLNILRNTLTDHVRSRNLHRRKENTYQMEKELFLEQDIEESFCPCVNHFMDEISHTDRELLHEHFLNGKTFTFLAKELGVSQATLRVKSLRAKEKLKEMFKAGCKVQKFEDFADCGCA